LPGSRVAASRAGMTMIGFSGAALVMMLSAEVSSDKMPGSSERRKRDISG